MSDHAAKQAAYEAKRRSLHPDTPPRTVERVVRHIGQPPLEHPTRIVYRADREAETREMLLRAGMVFADEGDPVGGNFY